MKRLILLHYVIICVALLGYAAQFTVPFVVDDAARVSIDVNGTPFAALVSGRNDLAVMSGSTVSVKAREGCVLVAVEEIDGDWRESLPISGNQCRINIFGDYGSEYRITSAKADDARSGRAFIWVDDPANVIVMRGESGDRIELLPGNNEVPFNTATESTFTISPSSHTRPLLKVLHNDVDVTAADGVRLTLASGDRLRIETEYPDVDYCVTLHVAGDYPDSPFVRTAIVDGVPTDISGGRFIVPAGAEVGFDTDTREWNVLSFEVDGRREYYTDSYTATIAADTHFAFAVEKYATLRVAVSVDYPENVMIYRGSHASGTAVDFSGAVSVPVDVDRADPYLTIVVADGCHITRLAAAGKVYPVQGSPITIGPLSEGDTVEISSYSEAGIEEVTADDYHRSGAVYDLAGRPVSKSRPTPGLYVRADGTKLIIH